jgi:GNAT superfamily N-acetyltransferase
MTAPTRQITSVITYLEMTAQPTSPTSPVPAAKLALLRTEPPSIRFYRYLYDAVGTRWLWTERRKLNDAALAAIIENQQVEVYVLYVGGVPAGFSELDRRHGNIVELAHFGLMEEFNGRGLTQYFLRWTIDQAWLGATRRLWVRHTTEDDPRLLTLHQKYGFQVYDQKTVDIDDPRPI